MDPLSFICSTCGQAHSQIRDIGFQAPDYWLGVAEDERGVRGRLTSDTCELDGQHFFVHGCLEIPVRGETNTFIWGVWVSLSEPNYKRYGELFEASNVENEGPYFGWLCNRIAGYPDTLLLKTNLHLRPFPTRPAIELEPTDHPLAIHQRQGVSRVELSRIVREVLHGSDEG
jgi:hypothetical protein